MAKEIKGVLWKPVEFEGPILNKDLEGLVGFEECIDYNLTRIPSKKPNKRKLEKGKEDSVTIKKKKNKVKVIKVSDDNNFMLSKRGSTNNVLTSTSNPINSNLNESKLIEWSSFGIPQSILKALAEQGFQKPTKIQELTLPSAILGRRDILGAAETGSGKTLAFGIPIVTGIIKLKEKLKSRIDHRKEINVDNKIGDYDLQNNYKRKKFNYSEKPLYALILTPTRGVSCAG